MDSETFEVVAQSGVKRFLVHSGILASQSQSLAEITRSKPTDRTIDFREWDVDTVGRFIEFLYVGRYHVPEPTQPESDDSDCPDTPATATAQSVASESRSDTTETRSDRTEIRSESPRPLTPLSHFELEPENHPSEDLAPWPSDPAVCDFREVLLAHAKVYFLARDQKVEALWRMAYKHLLSTLLGIGSIEPGWKAGSNTVDLLRYVYSRPILAEAPGEPLRGLVLQFAALNFPTLQRRSEMAELMREGGSLASDLMDKVCKRLVNSESVVREDQLQETSMRTRARFLEEALQESGDNLEKVGSELKAKQQEADTLGARVLGLEGTLRGSEIVLKKTETELGSRQTEAATLKARVGVLELSLRTKSDEAYRAETSLRAQQTETYSLKNSIAALELETASLTRRLAARRRV